MTCEKPLRRQSKHAEEPSTEKLDARGVSVQVTILQEKGWFKNL